MARGAGQFGPERLSYVQIDAWARLTDRHPLPHEVQALLTLDAVVCYPDPKGD